MLIGELHILTAVILCCHQNPSGEVDQQLSQSPPARIAFPVNKDGKGNQSCRPRSNIVMGSICFGVIEQGELEQFAVST